LVFYPPFENSIRTEKFMNSKRKLLVLFLLLVCSTVSYSTHYYTVTTGGFKGSIWSTTPGGSPAIALPTALATGDVLHVLHNVTLNASVTYAADITISIEGFTLTIDGQINVGAGSTFTFSNSSSKVVATPPGNSDKIFIGTGPSEWTGNEGALTGPGTISDGYNCNTTPCTLTPLPVKLAYLQASFSNKIAVVAWATIMEENFARFIIQRSSNGIEFEDITSVPGQGYDLFDTETKYSFEDKSPLIGYNYYRLKAVDLDDSFEYFGPISIKVNGAKALTVFPNPSVGQAISFCTNFSSAENDRIIVLNQLGVEVMNFSAASLKSNPSFEHKLAPGLYVFKYVSNDFEESTRLVVKN
jgi:hypothetical protein